MLIHIQLRDGRTFDVEAEGKGIGYLAEWAAAQTDEHRTHEYTLSHKRTRLDPAQSADQAGLEDGDTVRLVRGKKRMA